MVNDVADINRQSSLWLTHSKILNETSRRHNYVVNSGNFYIDSETLNAQRSSNGNDEFNVY